MLSLNIWAPIFLNDEYIYSRMHAQPNYVEYDGSCNQDEQKFHIIFVKVIEEED